MFVTCRQYFLENPRHAAPITVHGSPTFTGPDLWFESQSQRIGGEHHAK
jgi:hypothetical protein